MRFFKIHRYAYRQLVGISGSAFGIGRGDTLCVLLSGLLLLSGCDACNGDSTVPFKRKASSVEKKKKEAEKTPPSVDPAEEGETALTKSFAQETREVVIGGVPLIIEEGSIRAVLGFDLDTDGDQDALLVATNVEDNLVLLKAERTNDGYDTPLTIATLWSSIPNCHVASSTIQNLGSSYAEISANFGCETTQQVANLSQGKTSEDKSPEPTTSVEQPIQRPSQRELWIASLESVPRLFERIALLPDDEDRSPEKIDFQLTSRDLDSDGHDDIEMAIAITNPDNGEKNTVSMSWLNRPGGLARDRSQPEGLLLSLADRARNALSKNPDAALKKVERVQQLYDALCRQGKVSRLVINGVVGFDCVASTALGRASAVGVAAYAKKQNIVQALDSYSALDRSSLKVSARDRKLADKAIESIPSVEHVVWQQGPDHRGATEPTVRLSSIAFVDENTLLLRGPQPRFYHIDDQSVSDAEPNAGSVLIEDSSRRFVVVAIVRSCTGYHLRIVSASQAEAGITSGPAVSEPLIEKRPTRPGASCSKTPIEIEDDFGGYHVLGWTPQGIVVAAESRILLVAVDEQAQPIQATVAVTDAKALSAPIIPGASSPNGHIYGAITPIGVLIQRVLPSPKTLMIRPEQWNEQETSDVAISPSGRKVAYLRAGRVQIGKW